jgi:hypothetical protein
MEGMHSKMFDPPTEAPPTPDLLAPTNPVPEVMAANGDLTRNPPVPLHTVQRDLMHGMTLPTWDGKNMHFFLFRDKDGVNEAGAGSFPGPTIRIPRGAIYHCETQGQGPPPHTIQWHGQDTYNNHLSRNPIKISDGVGHISFEVDGAGYPTQVYRIGLDAELIDVGARTLGYGDRRQYSQPVTNPANEPVELTTALRALLIISLSGVIDVSRFFSDADFAAYVALMSEWCRAGMASIFGPAVRCPSMCTWQQVPEQ